MEEAKHNYENNIFSSPQLLSITTKLHEKHTKDLKVISLQTNKNSWNYLNEKIQAYQYVIGNFLLWLDDGHRHTDLM